ncbi:fibronectin type III domain-containing protein [Paenibacillus apiarius]|uniref:Fibronectin type III domain-containing protein n=1 Tax=Paenibacillus apiarius TaxID=46240 RepID=A0ABT4DUB2_9BACL|nr:fibronectin type III domain-containing protein [Paenibacillus apiarius]MCY9514532.1 fibronectin type III domain-containing protein [Paenibacillus apiarius]MCY9520929.1 fibronectin type III domain-containing protein [Paenibacillus apiarius]MCY9551777.1 fibronectin type III domain-containing protein [Paenibacillus apiarius]MCY9557664.1 fibronectin type III domain-containing protein [Paenibacillus apiarius]MCY9684351.1 fibronectin type III domain-containing protein [Paenibacillus apiarius]
MKFRGIISFLLGCLLILTPITSVNAVDGEDSSGIFFSRREPCVSNSYKPPIDFEYETENEKYLNSSPQVKPKFEPRFTPGSPQNVRITSNDTTSVCLVWEPPYIQFERLTYLVFQDNLPEGGEKNLQPLGK